MTIFQLKNILFSFFCIQYSHILKCMTQICLCHSMTVILIPYLSNSVNKCQCYDCFLVSGKFPDGGHVDDVITGS